MPWRARASASRDRWLVVAGWLRVVWTSPRLGANGMESASARINDSARSRVPRSIVNMAPPDPPSSRPGEGEVGVRGEQRIVHPRHAGMLLQPAGELQRRGAGAGHPQAEGREPAHRQPALERVAGLAQRRGQRPGRLDEVRGRPRAPRASGRCGPRSSSSPSASRGWRRARAAGRSAGRRCCRRSGGCRPPGRSRPVPARSATRSRGLEIVSTKMARVEGVRAARAASVSAGSKVAWPIPHRGSWRATRALVRP